MKKYLFLLLVVYLLSVSLNWGQVADVEKGLCSINQDVLKAQVGILASDWTEGRMAGEKGESIASDYLASMMQLYGVKPGGDYVRNKNDNDTEIARSYFQNIVLLKTTAGDEHILKIKSIDGATTKVTTFSNGVDFSIILTVNDIDVEAPVVFAGYGFKNNRLKFNDLSKLDVKGKFILKISGIPQFASKILTPEEIDVSARELETLATSNGAVGIIECNPNATVVRVPIKNNFNNMSPSENSPWPATYNAIYSLPVINNPDNLIRITVSVRTANEILKESGMEIGDYISKADANLPYILPGIPGKTVYLKSTRKTTSVNVRNIIGIIEGNNPEQVIVLGAHYDHLGMNNGYIWNGADDNASGTVGVLTIAKAIMETGKKPEKTIVIAFWTAEEEGLLGSRYWIQNPTFPLNTVKLNVNFDMISRYISDNEQNKITLFYTSLYPGFKDITAANLNKYGIDLSVDYEPSADPPGGTDHRVFVSAGIPIMRFKPGNRDEYHTPKDEVSMLDWDIMEKIVRISFTDVWELANTSW